jgi:hypothetical protein
MYVTHHNVGSAHLAPEQFHLALRRGRLLPGPALLLLPLLAQCQGSTRSGRRSAVAEPGGQPLDGTLDFGPQVGTSVLGLQRTMQAAKILNIDLLNQ